MPLIILLKNNLYVYTILLQNYSHVRHTLKTINDALAIYAYENDG